MLNRQSTHGKQTGNWERLRLQTFGWTFFKLYQIGSRVTRGAAAETEEGCHGMKPTQQQQQQQQQHQRLQLWRWWWCGGVQRLAAVIIDNVCCSSIVCCCQWLAFHSANSSQPGPPPHHRTGHNPFIVVAGFTVTRQGTGSMSGVSLSTLSAHRPSPAISSCCSIVTHSLLSILKYFFHMK